MKKSIPLITMMLLANSTSYGMIRHSLQSLKKPSIQTARYSSNQNFMNTMAKQIDIEISKIKKISIVLGSDPYSSKWEDITEETKEAFKAMDKITALLYTAQKVLEKNPIVMPDGNNTDTQKLYKFMINVLEPIESKLDDLHKACATKQDLIQTFNKNGKNHE